jgi:hypothetical protein
MTTARSELKSQPPPKKKILKTNISKKEIFQKKIKPKTFL